MAEAEVFGRTASGEDIRRITISDGGLTAKIMEWGAVLQDLRLEKHGPPLVLGFEEFAHYPAYSPHFGAVPGRFANRIQNGQFQLDGARFDLDRNQDNKHTLHGGSAGFSKLPWRITESGPNFVTLALRSADGDMGFPGNLDVRCAYRVEGPSTLSIELTAKTDHPTICNLTNHSYFNLDDGGASDILDHKLTLNAGAYLPVDADLIPTGVVLPVDGTLYDFRHGRTIRNEGEQIAYDTNFCIGAKRETLRPVANVRGPKSGLEMEMWTTEPGVQLYTASKLKPSIPAGLDGIRYKPMSGFCLEAQFWPDAPNRVYFPLSTLRPGETYRHQLEFRFK